MIEEKLTKEDVEKIKKEIEERKMVIRPKALEDLKTARAQGDLSENFEYYAAKKFNRENNSRIEYLEKMLKDKRDKKREKYIHRMLLKIQAHFEEKKQSQML